MMMMIIIITTPGGTPTLHFVPQGHGGSTFVFIVFEDSAVAFCRILTQFSTEHGSEVNDKFIRQ
eukprot:7691629-Karenia_brevis.AAC.1